MNYRTLTLFLLFNIALAVETDPAPAPVPPAPNPVGPTPTPAAPPSRAGVRVAQVAAAPPVWNAYARLSSMYDSNVLLDNDPDTSHPETNVFTTEAGIDWRPVLTESNFLKLAATTAYDRRPDIRNLDTNRLGLAAYGVHQANELTTCATANATRYWLDNRGAALDLHGGLSVGWLRAQHVDLASLEIGVLHFDRSGDQPSGLAAFSSLGHADNRSGVLIAAGWRHWWQIDNNSRIEAGARLGRFSAESDVETFTLVQPHIAVRLRQDQWSFDARVTYEWRTYADERTLGDGNERAGIASVSASADRRLDHNFSAGAFIATSARTSTADGRDYDRWLFGLRLTWTLSPEE